MRQCCCYVWACRFSFDEMLNLKGNTAVYLLYAHARIAGIVRKADKDIGQLAKDSKIVLEHPKEVELGLHLCKFTGASATRCSSLSLSIHEPSRSVSMPAVECARSRTEGKVRFLAVRFPAAACRNQAFPSGL